MIFSCVYWPSACPLLGSIYSGLLLIFLLDCLGGFLGVKLYEFFKKNLDINPFSAVLLVNIFVLSVSYLFIFLMVSFAVQKLFSLI